ncbi:hypothetical protein BGZ80_011465 [Entomortierella chlamydospora]|uniref:Uncharacterized protein n=1 Tax=Entomortierella chlamydospora TaxID=101097 RepID=A0A9P6SZ48_9FUNG|nr:hypothetical protein BGZ79_001046 [Entomortierella chlamydospora]KAG0012860.1 hypothetical protein BGZ80_011465 [Entomortierella chlamydospora]
MFPRNVLAIRKSLGSSATSEIITSITPKASNATLLDYPTGAYTGMRTFDKIGIMDFTGHTARLATSLQQIKFTTHADNTITTSTGTAINEDVAVTEGLAQLRNQETMKKETTDLVQAGLKFYYSQLRQNLQNGELTSALEGETKVTVLCTWDAKASTVKEPTLVAHFEPLKTPKESRCKVEIRGSPRQCATAKDSQWVRDRKDLEAGLDKDTNEALLLDNETQDLYEGLSSNFFALDRNRQTVMTAPLGSVLLGTIQKVVLNVCSAEKIPVDYTFPNLKHIDDWEGAFITSTSRLVLPIEKIVLPDGTVKVFEESPTIELIRRGVLKECRTRVEYLITENDV